MTEDYLSMTCTLMSWVRQCEIYTRIKTEIFCKHIQDNIADKIFDVAINI